MNIRIVAAGDIGSYIAADSDGAYYVITLDDTKEIDLGDILSGTFNGAGSLFYEVQNLTKRERVRICLETWDSPLDAAIEMLLGFRRYNPITVLAGNKRFVSHTNEIAAQLRNEIVRVGH